MSNFALVLVGGAGAATFRVTCVGRLDNCDRRFEPLLDEPEHGVDLAVNRPLGDVFLLVNWTTGIDQEMP